ncbi:MAG: hypothetical protein DYG89_03980 [Caldilinea sp. CFX5]|nr:hypothetical protein [Caldilinea sp. CFX5]
MRELSFVIAIPLTVLAYNISMKMDSHNIDQLVRGILIALIILALAVPTGLYLLAYLRDRQRNHPFDRLPGAGFSGNQFGAFGTGRPRHPYPHPSHQLHGPAGYWQDAPPPLYPTQPAQGSFVLQPPTHFQPEDWS